MEKILTIDDNKLIRRALMRTLSGVGYSTIEAKDGETGLQLVRSEHPDLVITDYQMPGINGLEVLSEIRKINAAIPVIMLTALGQVVLMIKTIQLGAFDFLEKPVDSRKLISTVQLALNSAKISNSLNKAVLEDFYSESILKDNILVGKAIQMKAIFKHIEHISMNMQNLLIQGDSGTGKKLIARHIHFSGITRDKPMVMLNCGTLAGPLLEDELFGHVKGSFTDSTCKKKESLN